MNKFAPNSVPQFLAKALIANEIEGDLTAAYEFNDPDGRRTGKSGYSFGRCQFDIFNNPRATKCLLECSFTAGEILRLREQTTDITDLNSKLKAHADIVDRYDFEEIMHTIDWVKGITQARGISFADTEAFIHAADYHNQYSMQANGKAITWFAALKRPVTAEDVKKYKLTTLWGKKRPDDVARRYNNIHKIFNQQEATP